LLQFTINVQISPSYIPRALQILCENCVLFIRADFHAPLSTAKMPASNSSRVPPFIWLDSLFLQLHKQKHNKLQQPDSNNSISVTIQN